MAVKTMQVRRPQASERKFQDLVSVGPAIERDFEMMGIRSVAQLAKQNPKKMYDKLCKLIGQRQDPCVLDTFEAAVAQAVNPRLAAEKCQWWYWSKIRKARDGKK
ncbi:MAG TPA: helix-hairpin-helix domain-containing protein [Candidatus Acidoferrales bacterium]|jgi:nucleotidyltransferase/DNA polymerase involved in DNA repair